MLLVDDLVATGGTLSAGIELVHAMGATVVEVRRRTSSLHSATRVLRPRPRMLLKQVHSHTPSTHAHAHTPRRRPRHLLVVADAPTRTPALRTLAQCACVVELKMFIDPPAESGLPNRSKSWKEKGIGHVPVWGLVSEDVLTLEGELPEGYVDDGEEH